MPYAVKADLAPRRIQLSTLNELTDDSNNAQGNDQVVTDVLAEASAQVDSYCRQKYKVPLQTSEQVKSLTIDIALYRLHQRRDRVTDSVRQAYEDAIQFLKDVAAGRAGLDQPTAAAAQTTSASVKATEKEERFSDDNLKGFI